MTGSGIPMISETESLFPQLTSSFLAQCLLSSCVLALGLSFGFLVKSVLPSKKKRPASAFSLLCVFLALAAVLFTALIFVTHSLFPLVGMQKAQLARGTSARLFYSVLAAVFSWGMLTALFWRIMLPASLVLYASLSFATACILKSAFGRQPSRIPVLIDAQTITVKSEPGSASGGIASPAREIRVTAYQLPDILTAPVRRNWFILGESFPMGSGPLSQNPVVSFYLESFLLSRGATTAIIALPETQIYPSLYSICVTFPAGKLHCELVRDL